MKNILYFGGTGFLGRNFRDYFTKIDDYTVVYPTRQECDLLDREMTISYIAAHKPDIIINSAFIGVNSRKDFTDDYLYNNLRIVTNILEGAREVRSLQKIIHFGSSLEYQDIDRPIVESDPLEPKNIYAVIKMTSSLLSKHLARQWRLPLILLRPFNLYGPYDNKSVIYYLISSILHKKSITVTNGEQKRDYMYIGDFMRLMHEILQKSEIIPNNEIFNIGTGKAIKLVQLFNQIYTATHFQGKTKKISYREHEYFSNIADISKISAAIPMNHITPLDQGMQKTIAWIKEQA